MPPHFAGSIAVTVKAPFTFSTVNLTVSPFLQAIKQLGVGRLEHHRHRRHLKVRQPAVPKGDFALRLVDSSDFSVALWRRRGCGVMRCVIEVWRRSPLSVGRERSDGDGSQGDGSSEVHVTLLQGFG